jgi:hypothetical protein
LISKFAVEGGTYLDALGLLRPETQDSLPALYTKYPQLQALMSAAYEGNLDVTNKQRSNYIRDLESGVTTLDSLMGFHTRLMSSSGDHWANQYLNDQIIQSVYNPVLESIFGADLSNKVIRQIAEGGWSSVDRQTQNQWNQAIRTQQLKDLMPYSSYQQEILNAYNGAENGEYGGITSMVTGLTNAAETDYLLDKYLQHKKLSDEEYRTLASS